MVVTTYLDLVIALGAFQSAGDILNMGLRKLYLPSRVWLVIANQSIGAEHIQFPYCDSQHGSSLTARVEFQEKHLPTEHKISLYINGEKVN